MDKTTNRTCVIILAAGSSKRFKSVRNDKTSRNKNKSSNENKLLSLLPCGNNLLTLTFSKYKVLFNDIVVVCQAKTLSQFKEHLPSAIFLVNKQSEQGLSSSLACGIQYAIDHDFDSALITLADKGFIAPSSIEKILKVSQKQLEIALVPYYRAERGNTNYEKAKQGQANHEHTTRGHPVYVPKSQFKNILDLKDKNGAKSLFTPQNSHTLELADPGICFDVDTPEDLQEARIRFY